MKRCPDCGQALHVWEEYCPKCSGELHKRKKMETGFQKKKLLSF